MVQRFRCRWLGEAGGMALKARRTVYGALILATCAPLEPTEWPTRELPVVEILFDGDGAEEIENAYLVDREYGAVLKKGGERMRCYVSLHGGATRTYPKRSYRIVTIDDEYPPVKSGKWIYSSQYTDPSFCRYRLADYFFGRADMIRPRVRPVRLYIEGVYQGYYLETEAVDSFFLKRRRMPISSLYKAAGPDVRFTRRTGMVAEQAFEKKLPEDDRCFADIDSLLRIIDQGIGESTRSSLEALMDVWNALDYYAVAHLIGHVDGMTNNICLYYDPRIRKFVFIPWDLDLTFDVLPLPFFAALNNDLFEKMARVPSYRGYLVDRMRSLFDLDDALGVLDSLYGVTGPEACGGPYAGLRGVDCHDEIESIRRFLSTVDSVLVGF
ncbi:MAG: hypothetical protein GF344_15975 [Chitinivibrionales bacterium]|nr:hypothetical protein [Chitinivibrionales bacterium]MBD3358193.1 hypothetical protein [Chitinivibrionales bacterium]